MVLVKHSQIHVFWSGDPNLAAESWRHAVVVQLHEGWTAYNTSPARGELDGNSVHGVAIELGTPAVVRGEGFSSIFAVCDDCDKTPSFHGSKGWRLLDPSKSIYSKDRYAAWYPSSFCYSTIVVVVVFICWYV